MIFGRPRTSVFEESVILHDPSLERSEVSPRRAVALLKEAQEEDMLSRWRSKKIHGPYRKTIETKGIDPKGSFLWLRAGRLSAQSEAL